MPSLKSLMQEYLTKDEIISLIDTYDNKQLTDEEKNSALSQFINTLFLPSMKDCFNLEPFQHITLLGSGTMGYVLKIDIPNNDIQNGFEKLNKNYKLYRVRHGIEEKPNKMAVKIQMFYTSNKYWETRALREEFILDKFNKIDNSVKEYIPKFYYGYTMNMTFEKQILKFRVTYMELIDDRYKTLEYVITQTGLQLSQIFINNIKTLVEELWKFGVSHNDLSIRNIMLNLNYPNLKDSIKLIDFGLATMINGVSDEKTYLDYFSKLDKIEQQGTNVDKINELIAILKQTNHLDGGKKKKLVK